MTAVERPIGEDELHAYVDGFLGPERRLTVERYLTDHPDAATRIAGWQSVGEALREAAAWKFQEPVPAALNIARLAEARIANRWGAWRIAAGIVIALALGAGSGWVARGPGEPSGAASAGKGKVALNRASGAHPVQLAAGQPAQLEGQVTQGSGGAVTPPDLSKSGYRLVGGQVVASGQGPACMLTYDNGQGTRITLLMRPVQKHDTSATQLAETSGGNGGRAPQLAEAGADSGGRVPQLAEAGAANGRRAPQLAEAASGNGGSVTPRAEAGGSNTGGQPRLGDATGGNSAGAATVASASPCS